MYKLGVVGVLVQSAGVHSTGGCDGFRTCRGWAGDWAWARHQGWHLEMMDPRSGFATIASSTAGMTAASAALLNCLIHLLLLVVRSIQLAEALHPRLLVELVCMCGG